MKKNKRKILKKNKKRGRPKIKKLGKGSNLGKVESVEKNLKFNEQKIEIKKVKKQPAEKRIFNIKDHVVYPKHGVGKILSIDKARIGEIDITFYKVFIEKEKLTLSIPLNQQSYLRPNRSIISQAISPDSECDSLKIIPIFVNLSNIQNPT